MALWSFLPQADGLLPKWQLLVAAMAFFNSAQNFWTLKLTRRVYNNAPAEVSALQARTFAVWTLTAGIVRLYCAYHVNEKVVYDLTLFTYLMAFSHFVSEIVFFRTASLIGPAFSPVVVATSSLIWMLTQYNFYVKAT